jgi:tRNA-uridine 2-sulfurtransferase
VDIVVHDKQVTDILVFFGRTSSHLDILRQNCYASSVMIDTKPQTVVVGLSGGVDSSVTAALLQQQGYAVIGIYMKNWSTESPRLGRHRLDPASYRLECPWYDDYLDAKRVAMKLGIPFHLWDFCEAYKQKVFDSFIEEFERGRTPNPDIFCNGLIKFDDFQRRALEELGADYVATGHYARKVEIPSSGVSDELGDQEPRYGLQIPADRHKDQTYFLYRLNQGQLAHALFPLADFTKDEVRRLAEKFDLPTKYKKDSQGICFIGDVDVRQFVSYWLAPKAGEIHDLQGRVIGEHNGAHLHTIGEKIAVDNATVARLYPEYRSTIPHFYVVNKDIKTNVVTVVPGSDHPALFVNEARLEAVVWSGETTVGSKESKSGSISDSIHLTPQFRARLRHGGRLVAIEVDQQGDGTLVVRFAEPQRAITPGQHCVIYDLDNRVVGGGIIQS